MPDSIKNAQTPPSSFAATQAFATYSLSHPVRPRNMSIKLDKLPSAHQTPLRLFSGGAAMSADEAKETLTLTWALWIPIHCLTFSVVPVPLRTHFVAGYSFCTLTCMSFLQASLERRR